MLSSACRRWLTTAAPRTRAVCCLRDVRTGPTARAASSIRSSAEGTPCSSSSRPCVQPAERRVPVPAPDSLPTLPRGRQQSTGLSLGLLLLCAAATTRPVRASPSTAATAAAFSTTTAHCAASPAAAMACDIPPNDRYVPVVQAPSALYTAAEVLANEQTAAKEMGLPMFQLMKSAGTATFHLLRDRFAPARVVVFTGKGNNGGDGYIVAHLCREHGIEVRVVQIGDAAALTGDAATARDLYTASGGSITAFDPADPSPLADALAWAEVGVDALLGGGMKGNVRGDFVPFITMVNEAGLPVLAVDVPSGLSPTTGQVLGLAVKAQATATYVALKQGLFTGQAVEHVGELFFAGLGVGDKFVELFPPRVSRVDLAALQGRFLAPRAKGAHKGHFGKVIVAGGDRGMPGAIRLAGEAAQRTGAGLVRVLTHPENLVAISAGRPELMISTWDAAQADEVATLVDWCSVLALGPGMGQTDWSRALFNATSKADKASMVIDADGLNLLAQAGLRSDSWVLTPHPGEAARLLGISTREIEADRFAAARAIQDKFGGVCLLKGAGTIICGGADQCLVAAVGNPGMATGGMGDTLTGIIAGLLAQHVPPLEAAALGAAIHGGAANLAAARDGERGLLASDLMPYIRQLVNPAQTFAQ